MKSSKGISPLVAAVLLIAVTMTIAGLLAYWASGFVKTSLPDINATEAECLYVEFSIYSCNYYNSTEQMNLILENLGEIDITNLNAYFVYANSTLSEGVPLNETLTDITSYTLTGVSEDFSKIMIRTHCPDKSKEKTCTRITT